MHLQVPPSSKHSSAAVSAPHSANLFSLIQTDDDQNEDGSAPDEEDFNIDMEDVEMMDSSLHDDSSVSSDLTDLGAIEDMNMEERDPAEQLVSTASLNFTKPAAVLK